MTVVQQDSDVTETESIEPLSPSCLLTFTARQRLLPHVCLLLLLLRNPTLLMSKPACLAIVSHSCNGRPNNTAKRCASCCAGVEGAGRADEVDDEHAE